MYYSNVIVYSLIAGLATIVGTFLVLSKEAWARRNSLYLVSFAAGVMLAAAFLHILPESLELNRNSLVMVLVGILIFYLLQQIITLHPCPDEACEIHRVGILSLIGLLFHSFLDGIAIAIGFEVDFKLGFITTMAVLLHELPEGIVTTSLLLFAQMKRVKVIAYSLLVALATPLGAIMFLPISKNISRSFLGILLALAGGSFIYIASSDLIPQTHKIKNKLYSGLLILGVLFLFIIGKLLY